MYALCEKPIKTEIGQLKLDYFCESSEHDIGTFIARNVLNVLVAFIGTEKIGQALYNIITFLKIKYVFVALTVSNRLNSI